jgi:hypothetical protein
VDADGFGGGILGRPGMVTMSPVSTTTKPTSLTVYSTNRIVS